MTSQPPFDPRLPKPGWYPDPHGRSVVRWWDGEQWTTRTQALAVQQSYGAGADPAVQQPRRASFTPAPQQPTYQGLQQQYYQQQPGSGRQSYGQRTYQDRPTYGQPQDAYSPQAPYRRPQAPQAGAPALKSRRHSRSRLPVYAGIAALIVIAAGGAAYVLAGHGTGGTSAAKPLTCKQQYDAWKTGPADAPGKQLETDLGQVSSAGNTEDITAMTSALKTAGADAAVLERYPMPACADPGGYWMQVLTHIKAAGDNAGSASGLGGILLAEAPLKEVPGLEQKLSEELKRATSTGKG